MKLLDKIHGDIVYRRRIFRLCRKIVGLLPPHVRVLDVGCGDGLLSAEISRLRPDVSVEGVDILIRGKTFIPVREFNGETLPHPDGSFDVVMFIDVLHHTRNPAVLLREAVRVSRLAIVIKDHTLSGVLAGPRLRLMDWVGNARYGVTLPYNYWPRERWQAELKALGLHIDTWAGNLGLYPWWADWIFGASLHFTASLTRSCSQSGESLSESAVVLTLTSD